MGCNFAGYQPQLVAFARPQHQTMGTEADGLTVEIFCAVQDREQRQNQLLGLRRFFAGAGGIFLAASASSASLARRNARSRAVLTSMAVLAAANSFLTSWVRF